MKFKIGDVVYLKSGGPLMVVSSTDEVTNCDGTYIEVTCEWLNKKGNPKWDDFDSRCLIDIKPL